MNLREDPSRNGMIENAKLSILHGGSHFCAPEWNRNKESYNFAQAFAFFLPVSGGARIETTGGRI
jgi:hypothetical protein